MDEEGHESISSILSRFHDVIYLILSHLSMKDLHRAARVNVTWSRVVQTIKRNRLPQIGWCDYNEFEPGGVELQIGQAIENLESEPHYALIFASQELMSGMVLVPPGFSQSARSLPRAVKQEQSSLTSFSSYMEKSLPASCHIVYVSTDGTIGTSFSSNRIVELGFLGNDYRRSASCLFLPKFSDVDIYPFMLRNKLKRPFLDKPDSANKVGNHAASRKAFDDYYINKKTSNGIPHDKCLKLILLFPTCAEDVFFSTLDYRNVGIAGGYGHGINFDGTESQKRDGRFDLGIAFFGGSDLHVASVVLGEDINSKELVEGELLRLKAAHLPESRSVAFMFTGYMRAECVFDGIKNVESEAFRELFPNTPLLGFFSLRQIGHDLLPDCADMMNMLAAVGYSTQEHSHEDSTVFLIISFP